jgi:hypothetical protein
VSSDPDWWKEYVLPPAIDIEALIRARESEMTEAERNIDRRKRFYAKKHAEVAAAEAARAEERHRAAYQLDDITVDPRTRPKLPSAPRGAAPPVGSDAWNRRKEAELLRRMAPPMTRRERRR